MQVGYKLRRAPLQRRLERQLMQHILQLLERAHRPMRDMEIISAMGERCRRSDPEFQRQVRVNLRDAVSYGILKRQLNVFTLRSKRLAEIMDTLVPRRGDTGHLKTNQHQHQHQQAIFIHSRSYGRIRSNSNGINSSCNSNNKKKFQHGRKSGGGKQMASGHVERSSGHNLTSSGSGEHAHNRYHSYSNRHGQGQEQGQGQGNGHGDSLDAIDGSASILASGLDGSNGSNTNTTSNSNSNSNSSSSSSPTDHMPFFYRHCSEYQSGPHANLSSVASVYSVRSWSGWDPRQRQQQQQQQHHHQQLQQQQQLGASHFEIQPLQASRSHQLNVSAPSFTPASARADNEAITARRLPIHLMPKQSQPELQTQSHSLSRSQSDRSSGRRQQLPDLFQTVLKLMREMNRSVSYQEMIGMLAMRLHRLPVELKRHIPHTLHGAVANGYLRKDGNYYTLLSEREQKEIMKRNQEAAKRAKELEKEPLSWRIR